MKYAHASMRTIAVALATLLAFTVPQSAHAWGFEAHKYIVEKAIALLPPEIRPFFERHRVTIAEHSIDPDLWRTVGWEAEEGPRHFVDLDAYGPFPFKALPRDLRRGGQAVRSRLRQEERPAAVARPGDAREARRSLHAKQTYSRENIKLFSSVIGTTCPTRRCRSTPRSITTGS